jgi:hypothetical protein
MGTSVGSGTLGVSVKLLPLSIAHRGAGSRGRETCACTGYLRKPNTCSVSCTIRRRLSFAVIWAGRPSIQSDALLADLAGISILVIGFRARGPLSFEPTIRSSWRGRASLKVSPYSPASAQFFDSRPSRSRRIDSRRPHHCRRRAHGPHTRLR